MKQSSTTNDDLQKAIDDITKSTKTDPVFSDPVAAPSSIPEGDTGELDEAVGPFPAPESEPVTPPTTENQFAETVPPEAMMPTDPNLTATFDTQGSMPPMPNPNEIPLPPSNSPIMPQPMLGPTPEPMVPPALEPIPEPIAPIPEPMPEPMPTITPEPADDTFATPNFGFPESAASTADTLGVREVKEAALRDLIPLLSHLDMNPSQKFNIYRHIFEDLRDYTVLDSAYRAATEISDDKERAEALLYLVEAIDKM